MNRRRFAATAGALALSTALPARAATVNRTRTRFLIPAYFYPGGSGLKEWDRLIAAAAGGKADVVVILNPASGPGLSVDPNYQAVLRRVLAAGVTPVGYVATTYAKKPAAAVQAEVDRWTRLYPGVQGIFFDEQASAAGYVNYQKGLYNYVRSTKGLGLVVTNPGTVCDEGYLARTTSDVVCLFEGPSPAGGFRFPAWTRKYQAGRIAVLPYAVPTAAAMTATLREAASAGAGCAYVTDRPASGPWLHLASYWAEEVAAGG